MHSRIGATSSLDHSSVVHPIPDVQPCLRVVVLLPLSVNALDSGDDPACFRERPLLAVKDCDRCWPSAALRRSPPLKALHRELLDKAVHEAPQLRPQMMTRCSPHSVNTGTNRPATTSS